MLRSFNLVHHHLLFCLAIAQAINAAPSASSVQSSVSSQVTGIPASNATNGDVPCVGGVCSYSTGNGKTKPYSTLTLVSPVVSFVDDNIHPKYNRVVLLMRCLI